MFKYKLHSSNKSLSKKAKKDKDIIDKWFDSGTYPILLESLPNGLKITFAKTGKPVTGLSKDFQIKNNGVYFSDLNMMEIEPGVYVPKKD